MPISSPDSGSWISAHHHDARDSAPVALAQRHGGNLRELADRAGLSQREILDFSANLNPLGPPAWLAEVVNAHLTDIGHYPDPESTGLIEAIAARFGVETAEIAVGNGSAELLTFLPLVLPAERAVVPIPAYVDYRISASDAGLLVKTAPLLAGQDFSLDLDELQRQLRPHDLVFIGRPNNPTGCSCDGAGLRDLALENPQVTFLVDQAFGDFVQGFDSLVHRRPANVVVLQSFTKAYAIPGLRLGCAFAAPQIASRLRRRLPPWSVNALAQAVGCEALRDGDDYLAKARVMVAEERSWLLRQLGSCAELLTFPSEANFLLLRIERTDLDAAELARRTLRQGIAIRVCENYDGLDTRYFRVAVRAREENLALCRALGSALGQRDPARDWERA